MYDEPADASTPVPVSVSASEVTLVEVTLLGDLVRILKTTEAHHAALVEQQRRANEHRAARVAQERVRAACALRSELRAYNAAGTLWKPLPLENGDAFPSEEVAFPANMHGLQRMTDAQVRRLAAVYEIGIGLREGGGGDVGIDVVRENVALFLAGRRS